MFLDRKRVTGLFLLMVCFVGVIGGEGSRKSRSIEDRLSTNTGLNSDHYRFRKSHDINRFDRIGDRSIDRADISEDARRVVRQIRRHRPGLFWTLARVIYETLNETRSAIGQINDLVANNIVPDTTTQRGTGQTISIGMVPTTTQSATAVGEASTTTAPMETTEETFKLTPRELRNLVRRNLRGLVRLFEIEWRDALNQSHTNVRDFQRTLGNRISPFLQDNPDVV